MLLKPATMYLRRANKTRLTFLGKALLQFLIDIVPMLRAATQAGLPTVSTAMGPLAPPASYTSYTYTSITSTYAYNYTYIHVHMFFVSCISADNRGGARPSWFGHVAGYCNFTHRTASRLLFCCVVKPKDPHPFPPSPDPSPSCPIWSKFSHWPYPRAHSAHRNPRLRPPCPSPFSSKLVIYSSERHALTPRRLGYHSAHRPSPPLQTSPSSPMSLSFKSTTSSPI